MYKQYSTWPLKGKHPLGTQAKTPRLYKSKENQTEFGRQWNNIFKVPKGKKMNQGLYIKSNWL